MKQKNIEIAVKNMVCNRCIKVVREELTKKNIDYTHVDLGTIYFNHLISEKEKEIQSMEQRVQQFNMEKFGPNGGEIYKIQNQLFAPVQAKIQAAIDKVGNAEGYDFILDAQSGAFVFAGDKFNLTHAVLEELRKNLIEDQND